MPLADLLKPSNQSEKAAALVVKLRRELEEAQAKLETINTEYSEALMTEAEGSGDSSASDRLEKQWTAAKREVQKKSAAFEAATARHKASLTAAEDKNTDAAWTRAEALSASRTAQVAKLAESAKRFAADYLDLLRISADLDEALSIMPDRDLDGAMLRQAQIETAIRQHLVRLGLSWEITHPWGVVSMPDITERFQGIPELIHRWHESATAKR